MTRIKRKELWGMSLIVLTGYHMAMWFVLCGDGIQKMGGSAQSEEKDGRGVVESVIPTWLSSCNHLKQETLHTCCFNYKFAKRANEYTHCARYHSTHVLGSLTMNLEQSYEFNAPALDDCSTSSLQWSTSHSYDRSRRNSIRMPCLLTMNLEQYYEFNRWKGFDPLNRSGSTGSGDHPLHLSKRNRENILEIGVSLIFGDVTKIRSR
ncbi:hypothetical protein Scep_010045 [Stephania cephalantha]|uniref:Uncharacterized protein n=1 Tax=Stephania cephalantha TaxID=152367 RepID=A0AAP0PEV2_9MAGN